LLALSQLLAGAGSARYNLGNGNGYSIREVIDAVRRVTGHPIPVEVGERRAGDPPTLVADARAARRVLGWQPRYGDLDTSAVARRVSHPLRAAAASCTNKSS
jgi:UDP-glucose 4-epimerase